MTIYTCSWVKQQTSTACAICTYMHIICNLDKHLEPHVNCTRCRFLTRPSMSERSNNATAAFEWANEGLSEDTQSRLLLSQNSVTARFEAQKLWDEGYAGSKVKVGVFDTGIRADHPHVKNIRYAPTHPFAQALMQTSLQVVTPETGNIQTNASCRQGCVRMV